MQFVKIYLQIYHQIESAVCKMKIIYFNVQSPFIANLISEFTNLLILNEIQYNFKYKQCIRNWE